MRGRAKCRSFHFPTTASEAEPVVWMESRSNSLAFKGFCLHPKARLILTKRSFRRSSPIACFHLLTRVSDRKCKGSFPPASKAPHLECQGKTASGSVSFEAGRHSCGLQSSDKEFATSIQSVLCFLLRALCLSR